MEEVLRALAASRCTRSQWKDAIWVACRALQPDSSYVPAPVAQLGGSGWIVEAAVEAQNILSGTSVRHTLSDAIRAHQGLLSKSLLHRLQTLNRSACAVRHTTPAASRALLSDLQETLKLLSACTTSSSCSSTGEIAVVAESELPLVISSPCSTTVAVAAFAISCCPCRS